MLTICSYQKSEYFYEKNSLKIPFIYKVLKNIIPKKQINLVNQKGEKIILEKISSFEQRKRKIMVIDDNSELVIHSFNFPFKKNYMRILEINLNKNIDLKIFHFPDIHVINILEKSLLLLKKKLMVLFCLNVNNKLDRFLEVYLADIKKNTR